MVSKDSRFFHLEQPISKNSFLSPFNCAGNKDFTIKLDVNPNRDWVDPLIIICIIMAVVVISPLLCWLTTWIVKKQTKRRRAKEKAVFSVLHNANEEAFKVQSENISLLDAVALVPVFEI